MDNMTAIDSFAALAQPTRLDVFRLLVRAGHEGCTAGEISKALNIRQNTMSTNLAILARTNLVTNQREGRSVRYFANYEGISELICFLMEDCCGGNREICQPILDEIACER